MEGERERKREIESRGVEIPLSGLAALDTLSGEEILPSGLAALDMLPNVRFYSI